MSGALLGLRRHGEVLEVVLGRPDRRNALSRDLLRALGDTFSHLPADVRAVMLSASGPVFTAGADFADLTGTSRDVAYDADLSEAARAIRQCPVPVIAAINGACLGAGVELVTACEVRVVGPQAWFRVPAIELGLLYNPESTRRLHGLLPRTAMTRLFVLAERIDADEAVLHGLATHAVGGDARVAGLDIAVRLTTVAPEALRATRELLADLDAQSHDAQAYDAQAWQATRLRILDSPTRRAAVATAAQTHATHPTESTEDLS